MGYYGYSWVWPGMFWYVLTDLGYDMRRLPPTRKQRALKGIWTTCLFAQASIYLQILARKRSLALLRCMRRLQFGLLLAVLQ